MADQHEGGTATAEIPPVLAEFVDTKLKPRMEELRPQVDEFNELQATMNRVLGIDSHPEPRRASGGGRRGRRANEPSAADEFMRMLAENPGSTVSEVAKALGRAPNYFYRIRDQKLEAGDIEERDKHYWVKGSAPKAKGK